jgi:hypothetical protein
VANVSEPLIASIIGAMKVISRKDWVEINGREMDRSLLFNDAI